MSRRLRLIATGLLVLSLGFSTAMVADAEEICGSEGWSDEPWTAQSDDRGLGGTGIAGDDSGLGGTGISGDDSGLGGTGIFGTITALGSVCVNGAWVHFEGDVEVVFENGIAIGAEVLAVGQTVWLVAQEGDQGLETDKIWVLAWDAPPRAARQWLEARIRAAGDLARLSLEGPVDGWQGRGRFHLRGVTVDAPDRTDLRGRMSGAPRVRVVGPMGRDGVLRAERIQLPVRPPRRPPQRPVVRPPRIEKPPRVDRPVRPEAGPRLPVQTDRVSPDGP